MYKRYEKYKPSGVEWIGKIPEHWEVVKLKYVLKLSRGVDLSSNQFIHGIYPVMGSNGIIGFHNEYNCLGPCITVGRSGSVGEVNFVRKNFWAHNTTLFLQYNYGNDILFLYYLLLSLDLKSLAAGSAVGTLNRNHIHQMLVACPNLLEQKTIAHFLDQKTALIDRIISNRRKQIELLKEERKAIINKAVTKGINQNAKLKPSGIEWLGDIPEHWKQVMIRRVTKEHKQGFYSDAGYVDNGFSLIRITDIDKDGNISIENSPKVHLSDEEQQLFNVKENDFLFPRTGSIGLLGLAKNISNAVFASYLIRFRFNSKTNPIYLKYVFISDFFLSGLKSDLHGGVNQNIHAEDIKNQLIPLPNLSEQSAITQFIEHKTAKIDIIITKYEKQISLLEEYRTSLISKAVTGQIDVRDWQPKEINTNISE